MGLSASYNGAFTDDAVGNDSNFDPAGHGISLRHASFTGSSGGTALDGGTKLSNSKLARETGSLALGDASGGTASIINHAGATYDVAGAVSLSAASATLDTIDNAGLFAKTGAGTAIIGAAFTNSGTIEVTSGTLEITAAFANSGTIIGTEMQSSGTTFITAPAALFNQYAAGLDSPAGSAALAPPPSSLPAPSLAAPHAG